MRKTVLLFFAITLIVVTKEAFGATNRLYNPYLLEKFQFDDEDPNCTCSPFLQKTCHFYIGPGYDYHEYGEFKVGLSFLDIKIAAYNWNKNFYIGYVAAKKSPIGGELGFAPTIVSANKGQKDELEFGWKVGLVYHYRLPVTDNHGHELGTVVPDSTNKYKMAAAVVVGLNFRAGRFNFYAIADVGCFWTPQDPKYITSRNTLVYRGVECGISMLIFNKVKHYAPQPEGTDESIQMQGM